MSTDPDRERLLRTAKETNQARQVRARALRVHTLRLLAGGQRMLDDSCEAVLAVADLDVAGLSENVDCRLACDGRRARAESERDLFSVSISGGCRAPHGLRRLSRGGRAHCDLDGQPQQADSYH